jgi:hypothetical protein
MLEDIRCYEGKKLSWFLYSLHVVATVVVSDPGDSWWCSDVM